MSNDQRYSGKIYDVAVIGAGITGSMTAYKLAKYKLSVIVLEKGSDIASGATKANSAIVHAGFDAVPGTLKGRLNADGCRQIKEISEKLNVHYINCGSLVCAFGKADEDHLDLLYSRGIANGVEGMRIIRGDELFELEPRLSRECTSALFAPTAGIVCPWGLPTAVCEVAAVNGTDFLFSCEAKKVEQRDGYLEIIFGDTPIRARYIVNASGLGADLLVENDILPDGEEEPLRLNPRRGEYMLLDSAEGGIAKHTLFVCPSEKGKGILVSPTAHGNIIVGPNANEVDFRDDSSVTAAGLDEISAGARRLIPDINLRASITEFAGVRPTPMTKAKDFVIKASKQFPTLLHAAGIDSPGLACGPAVADYIVGKLGEMGLSLIPNPDFKDSRPPSPCFKTMSDEEKAAAIKENPAFGRIICRCETITEAEIVDAITRPVGARDLDGVKRRVRAGMGRCQGGFCSPRVTAILSRLLHKDMYDITKKGPGSEVLSRPETGNEEA